MTTHDQLDAALTDLADVLDGIDPDQDGLPTPCTDFTVSALRGHVLRWLTSFATGLADPEGRCPTDEVVVEGRGGAQVRDLAGRIAATSDRLPEHLVIGADGLPTPMALSMIVSEYLVHGWDLAVATGQRYSPDEAACADAAAFLDGMLPDDAARSGMFGPRVDLPTDAPALDRLLGVAGRDPRWSPTS